MMYATPKSQKLVVTLHPANVYLRPPGRRNDDRSSVRRVRLNIFREPLQFYNPAHETVL